MEIKRIGFFIVLIITSLFFSSCKENVTPPDTLPIKNYFPLPNSNVYKYTIDSLSTSGTSYSIATKWTSFGPEVVTGGTPYFTQIEQIDYRNGFSIMQRPKVRRTERGLYYYFDTTGISTILPDSLKRYLTIDREVTALSLPFYAGQSWSGYKFSVVILSIIDCKANYLGSVQIADSIKGVTGKITAERIGYTLNISVPDLGQGTLSLSYSGEIWFAENIGVVKKEGDYFLFEFLSGNQLDLLMPSYKIREKLVQIGN